MLTRWDGKCDLADSFNMKKTKTRQTLALQIRVISNSGTFKRSRFTHISSFSQLVFSPTTLQICLIIYFFSKSCCARGFTESTAPTSFKHQKQELFRTSGSIHDRIRAARFIEGVTDLNELMLLVFVHGRTFLTVVFSVAMQLKMLEKLRRHCLSCTT